MPPSLLDKLPRTEQDAAAEDPDYEEDEDENIQEWRDDDALRPVARGSAPSHRGAADWTATTTFVCSTSPAGSTNQPKGCGGIDRHSDDLLSAYAAGAATLADFYDHLIGPRAKASCSHESFDAIRQSHAGNEQGYPLVDERPELRQAVNAVVERIIQIELARGEAPTAATVPAMTSASSPALDRLLTLIAALGKHGFAKSARWGQSENKPAVLTRLIRIAVPLPDDTPEVFKARRPPRLPPAVRPRSHG